MSPEREAQDGTAEAVNLCQLVESIEEESVEKEPLLLAAGTLPVIARTRTRGAWSGALMRATAFVDWLEA